MDRREAISSVGLLLGGTIVGSGIFIDIGCQSTPEQVNRFFTQDQLNLLDEISETILPTTHTPGAKAAKVAEFISIMVKDCYTQSEQQSFMDGLIKIEEECIKINGKNFIKCSPDERTSFLSQMDAQQKSYTENKTSGQPPHYFRMMKELTLLGFFSSETGATQVLRYVAVPGKYDGEMPYKKGDRAWAT